MVTGSGPQSKVMTPPVATAATNASPVQLAGVPVPTTVVGRRDVLGRGRRPAPARPRARPPALPPRCRGPRRTGGPTRRSQRSAGSRKRSPAAARVPQRGGRGRHGSASGGEAERAPGATCMRPAWALGSSGPESTPVRRPPAASAALSRPGARRRAGRCSSSSSSIRYFGPSGSSYWPLRTDQRKPSQAAMPSPSEMAMRKPERHGSPRAARRVRARIRSEFRTTKAELAAMAAARDDGMQQPGHRERHGHQVVDEGPEEVLPDDRGRSSGESRTSSGQQRAGRRGPGPPRRSPWSRRCRATWPRRRRPG